MRLVAAALCVLLLGSGCKSSLERANEASMRDNWDKAVEHYSEALKECDDPQEAADIKARLNEAKNRAGAQHLQQAENALAVGDCTTALEHAESAFLYDPTPAAQALLRQLKETEGARQLEAGKRAHANSEWAYAVLSLEAAQRMAPTDEGARLLAESRAQLVSAQAVEATLARAALESREWSVAVEHYRNAGESAQVDREREFATLMADAEANAARAESNVFSGLSQGLQLRKALGYGIDVAYVQYMLDRIEPASYQVTINGALILPFKPGEHTPWDGPGGALPGAGSLIATIVTTASGGTGLIGAAAVEAMSKEVLGLAAQGTAAPDCYLVIRADGGTFGGEATVDQDDYQPTWGVGLVYENVTKADRRVVSIEVRDSDAMDDDNVGSLQLTLEELLKEDGAREFLLVEPDGTLRAGGVIALKISVERR